MHIGTVLVKATEGTEVLEEVRICKETTTTAVVETAEVGAVPTEENEEERVPYVFGEEEMKRLNKVLSKYCGTHNFHNFTARMKPEDPSAKRYMISFTAGDVFEINGIQFVRCTVVGQSFMLHQIRKMIGMAIAIMRGCAPDSIIDMALRRCVVHREVLKGGVLCNYYAKNIPSRV
jgi:tRNA pseudouridine38-40 synthase